MPYFIRFATRDFNDFEDHFIDLQTFLLRRCLVHKSTDPIDHLGCTVAILNDVSECVLHLVQMR